MKSKKGFSLVELLIVIAIIGILALLVLPNFLSSFRNAGDKAMIVQENEVVDSAKLFIEDYCRNPLESNKGLCSTYSLDTSVTNKKYTCLNVIQSTKYIDDIISQGQMCNGFIVYSKEYKEYKAYIQCGEGYQTKGINNIKDASGESVIDKCFGNSSITPPTQAVTPTVPNGTLMAGTIGAGNYLRTNISKTDIEKITFTNSLSGHTANGTNCFDVSNEENGSVLAWVSDSDSNGLYEITVGSSGKVFASTGADLFHNLTNLKTINGMQYFDTSNVTSMLAMFGDCTSLTSLDLSYFNTSNVNNMGMMFEGCKSLTTLDLRSFNTSKVGRLDNMFEDCFNLTSVDLSSFVTTNASIMSFMFSGCKSLTTLDLRSFNTSNVSKTNNMFYGCTNLVSIYISTFSNNEVYDMSSMFYNCTSLRNLDLSNFYTPKVMYMDSMFYNCSSLTELDLSKFDTSKVTNMHAMFSGCTNMQNLDFFNFNTAKVKDMSSMFNNCSSLTTLDLSSFNTVSVTEYSYMFHRCTSLTSVDLANFNTSVALDMDYMFYSCGNLVTIYVGESFNTSSVTTSIGMFGSDYKLKGEAGTTYSNSNPSNKTYAHIDGGVSNPGYFTKSK